MPIPEECRAEYRWRCSAAGHVTGEARGDENDSFHKSAIGLSLTASRADFASGKTQPGGRVFCGLHVPGTVPWCIRYRADTQCGEWKQMEEYAIILNVYEWDTAISC